MRIGLRIIKAKGGGLGPGTFRECKYGYICRPTHIKNIFIYNKPLHPKISFSYNKTHAHKKYFPI